MSDDTRSIIVPYPLRPDFIASVEVPRDMLSVEAERLAAFIMALGSPKPEREP